MASDLWLAGNTGAFIANTLAINFPHVQRTRLAVIGKLNRLGLKRSNPEQFRHEQKRLDAKVKTIKDCKAAKVAEVDAPIYKAFERTPTTVAFLSRGFGQCAWPVDLDSPEPLCCGAPRDGKGSYCAAHARLSIRKAA